MKTFGCIVCMLAAVAGECWGGDVSAVFESDVATVVKHDPVRSYGLTAEELRKLDANDLVVTERVAYFSFAEAYYDIYRRDLPVYLTLDSVFHAIHRSFDVIVMELESSYIIPRLKTVLDGLASQFLGTPSGTETEKELRIRILVARRLLTPGVKGDLLEERFGPAIESQVTLVQSFGFNTKPRRDFGQCRPRAHYTKTAELRQYFMSVMYLGLMPAILWADPHDVDNRTIDFEAEMGAALMLGKALRGDPEVWQAYCEMEQLVGAAFGQANDVAIGELLTLRDKHAGETPPTAVALGQTVRRYVEQKREEGVRFRVSCVPTTKDSPSSPTLRPPICVSLCPRRVSLDAVMLWQLVNDRVPRRYVPSPLDVAASMGSREAERLQRDETARHRYRDDYDDRLRAMQRLSEKLRSEPGNDHGATWQWFLAMAEMFHGAEDGAEGATARFGSQAYQLRRLQTFLGAYAEYRHDLTAYSIEASPSGTMCEFPHVFIDPFPRSYRRLASFALALDEAIPGPQMSLTRLRLRDTAATFERLANLAQKEVDGVPFDDPDRAFLKNLIDVHWPYGSGTISYSGWYARLFADCTPTEVDMIVGSFFSIPPGRGIPLEYRDRAFHLGTGPVHLAFYKLEHEGKPVVFAGPVYSTFSFETHLSDRPTDLGWADLLGVAPLSRFREEAERLGLVSDGFGEGVSMLEYGYQTMGGKGLGLSASTRLRQPPWLSPILCQSPEGEFVRIARSLPQFRAVPLRLKGTVAEPIIEALQRVSSLKHVCYDEESHALYVRPASLVDPVALCAFVYREETEQARKALRKQPFWETLEPTLRPEEKWRYWASLPEQFFKDLLQQAGQGEPFERRLAYHALASLPVGSCMFEEHVEALAKLALEEDSPAVLKEVRALFGKQRGLCEELLPLYKKLGIWKSGNRDAGGWSSSSPVVCYDFRSELLADAVLMAHRGGPSVAAVGVCRPVVRQPRGGVVLERALRFLEETSGFAGWRHHPETGQFVAERTAFWIGLNRWGGQGRVADCERALAIRCVTFADLPTADKLAFAAEHARTNAEAVKRFLVDSLQHRDLACALNALVELSELFPEQLPEHRAVCRQRLRDGFTGRFPPQVLGYRFIQCLAGSPWEDLHPLAIHWLTEGNNGGSAGTFICERSGLPMAWGRVADEIPNGTEVRVPDVFCEYLRANKELPGALRKKLAEEKAKPDWQSSRDDAEIRAIELLVDALGHAPAK